MSILACPPRLVAVTIFTTTAALLTALLAALLTTGCASTPPERDARGHPRIERMSATQLARLEPSTPSPAAQTEAINAQVQREIAEADAQAAREARERQRELRARRQDPFYADPFYSPFFYSRPLWPGYWGWQLNYPPRHGFGLHWHVR